MTRLIQTASTLVNICRDRLTQRQQPTAHGPEPPPTPSFGDVSVGTTEEGSTKCNAKYLLGFVHPQPDGGRVCTLDTRRWGSWFNGIYAPL